MCIKWHQNCNTIRKEDTLPESLQSELSRFQKGYPLFIIIFLNSYATLCILLNTICADISFQESGKGQHAQRPRRLRIGIPIYFLTVVELKYSSIINHCADISFQKNGKGQYAQRPRRLRIGIPICFTAVVELKCSSIINHCADILFIQRESRFQKGYPLFYHIFKSLCRFMCSFNTICAKYHFYQYRRMDQSPLHIKVV